MLSFDDRVKNYGYQMTVNEEELVDYITTHKEEVSQIKIVVLAEELDIATNTITRFCHKLNYESFSELKHRLKDETTKGVNNDYQNILNKNFDLIDPEREEKAVRFMSNAKKVNFYALDQTSLLLRVSAKTFFAHDDKFRFHEYQSDIKRRIELGYNEIFFFVSLTGESDSVIEMARYAKNKGHKVISLTNLSDNTLSKISDITLFCYTLDEKTNDYDTTDKTPVMIILHSLYLAYCKK